MSMGFETRFGSTIGSTITHAWPKARRKMRVVEVGISLSPGVGLAKIRLMWAKCPSMKTQVNRRDFLGRGLVASAGLCSGSAGLGAESLATPASAGQVQPNCKGTVPTGRIGGFRFSRLISGGNLLSGWCHQRDLLFVRNLAAAYLTVQKQHDTLQMLEENGVNSIIIDMIQLEILNRYKKERGGKMQAIVSVREDWGNWTNPKLEDLKTAIRQTIDQGPAVLYLHGGYADRLVESGKPERVEMIGQALDFIRGQRFSAGLGAHELEVLRECDRRKVHPDFYVKTFHHDRYWSATPRDRRKPFCVDGPGSLDHNEFHDNIFCLDAAATAEFMADRPEPWIAFKVLAAGAIEPRSGFKFAFENGADFIAVGMFDFEVQEDLSAVRQVLTGLQRERSWRA